MTIDLPWLVAGFVTGILVNLAYFWSLALSVRLALHMAQPGGMLMLASLCRIVVLLGLGYWLADLAGNPWPLPGYVLAYFISRFFAITWARSDIMVRSADRGL